jgi:hypothetical protein
MRFVQDQHGGAYKQDGKDQSAVVEKRSEPEDVFSGEWPNKLQANPYQNYYDKCTNRPFIHFLPLLCSDREQSIAVEPRLFDLKMSLRAATVTGLSLMFSFCCPYVPSEAAICVYLLDSANYLAAVPCVSSAACRQP